jgi:arylsulfatase A-like enzyme
VLSVPAAPSTLPRARDFVRDDITRLGAAPPRQLCLYNAECIGYDPIVAQQRCRHRQQWKDDVCAACHFLFARAENFVRKGLGRRTCTLLMAGTVTAVAIACWPARRPNVLIITVDALRPDYLSCYGGAAVATPHIDALASGGVLFAQAVCDVPWTRASMASVMTGRYATQHQVRTVYERLGSERPTMAEAFQKAGYRTGAVVSEFQLDHIFQLDRGFDTYDDRFDAAMMASAPRPLHVASIFYGQLDQDRAFRRHKLHNDSRREDALTSDAAIGWLRHAGAQPFFLWVHYFGTHELLRVHADPEAVMAQYPRDAARVDSEVGRLLRALAAFGFDQNTLVVLHADHGQDLLEHGGVGHGNDLYESSLRVPLIMRWPRGLPAGRRVDALVRLVDIFPSVAELAGVPIPADLAGRSLVGLARGTDARGADEAYCETFLPATAAASQKTTDPDGHQLRFGFVRRGIRSERWMYIRSEPGRLVDIVSPDAVPLALQRAGTREELYDLTRDPAERHNLIGSEGAVAAELRARLERHVPLPPAGT